jgi:hypothetical protein
MTAGDIIDTVRRRLNDLIEGEESWPDSVLLEYLSNAEKRVKAERPDLFLGSGDAMQTPSELTATTDTLTLDEKSRPALVAWVCHEALSEDHEDTTNQDEANRQLLSFYRLLGKVKVTSG